MGFAQAVRHCSGSGPRGAGPAARRTPCRALPATVRGRDGAEPVNTDHKFCWGHILDHRRMNSSSTSTTCGSRRSPPASPGRQQCRGEHDTATAVAARRPATSALLEALNRRSRQSGIAPTRPACNCINIADISRAGRVTTRVVLTTRQQGQRGRGADGGDVRRVDGHRPTCCAATLAGHGPRAVRRLGAARAPLSGDVRRPRDLRELWDHDRESGQYPSWSRRSHRGRAAAGARRPGPMPPTWPPSLPRAQRPDAGAARARRTLQQREELGRHGGTDCRYRASTGGSTSNGRRRRTTR